MMDDIKPCCSANGRSKENNFTCPYEANKSRCPFRSRSIEACKRVNCRALYGYGGLQRHKKAIIIIDTPKKCPNRYVSAVSGNAICGITKKSCDNETFFSKDCPLEDEE